MDLFVGYASTDGHTRKIARYVADHAVASGYSVELLPLSEADDLDVSRFSRAILAASIHAGQYQSALGELVEAERNWLNSHPTLFLSVSLSAAGHDAEEWRGLEQILSDFKDATGWSPGEVVQVAGAYRPSRYGLLNRVMMRKIIATKDPDADPAADKDYTDWARLAATLEGWLAA